MLRAHTSVDAIVSTIVTTMSDLKCYLNEIIKDQDQENV